MSYKVLIVDDEKDVTLVLKDFFASKGYEVLAAFNGKEAMGFLGQPGIGLILLDMHLPDMDGIEILKEVKKSYKEAKVVVLTGFSDEYKKEAERLGCDAFLTKPFSVKTLVSVAESVLAGRGKSREEAAALIGDDNVLAKARLLFIEPNEIIYSSKLGYFRDSRQCKGRYQLTAAFTVNEALEKLEEFKPDILLSDISVFRLYKLNDRISNLKHPVKDIILYGLFPGSNGPDKDKNISFIGGLFDSVAAMINPGEMDKLGAIVRRTAIEQGLYIKVQ